MRWRGAGDGGGEMGGGVRECSHYTPTGSGPAEAATWEDGIRALFGGSAEIKAIDRDNEA